MKKKKRSPVVKLVLFGLGSVLLMCVCFALLMSFSSPSTTPASSPPTIEPAQAPMDTPTPPPTATPVSPTATSVPPTPTLPPEPILFEGAGDSIVDLVKWKGPAILIVEGNAESQHFAVIAHGGDYWDLIVNTIDPYQGVVIVGVDTTVLEVMATGLWTLDIIAR